MYFFQPHSGKNVNNLVLIIRVFKLKTATLITFENFRSTILHSKIVKIVYKLLFMFILLFVIMWKYFKSNKTFWEL